MFAALRLPTCARGKFAPKAWKHISDRAVPRPCRALPDKIHDVLHPSGLFIFFGVCIDLQGTRRSGKCPII